MILQYTKFVIMYSIVSYQDEDKTLIYCQARFLLQFLVFYLAPELCVLLYINKDISTLN